MVKRGRKPHPETARVASTIEALEPFEHVDITIDPAAVWVIHSIITRFKHEGRRHSSRAIQGGRRVWRIE